jgi:hypothetical protein
METANGSHEEFEIDVVDLPLDVFELADPGLTIESLTAGHGMPENAASAYTSFCICSCSRCSS